MFRIALFSCLSALTLGGCKPAADAPGDAAQTFDAGTPDARTRTTSLDGGAWVVEHLDEGGGEPRKVVQHTADGPTRSSEDTNGDGKWDVVEERQYEGGREVFRERREDRDFDGLYDKRSLREATPDGLQRRVTYELLPVDGGPMTWKPTREVVAEPDWN